MGTCSELDYVIQSNNTVQSQPQKMNTWLIQHVSQSQKQALETEAVAWMLFWLTLF